MLWLLVVVLLLLRVVVAVALTAIVWFLASRSGGWIHRPEPLQIEQPWAKP